MAVFRAGGGACGHRGGGCAGRRGNVRPAAIRQPAWSASRPPAPSWPIIPSGSSRYGTWFTMKRRPWWSTKTPTWRSGPGGGPTTPAGSSRFPISCAPGTRRLWWSIPGESTTVKAGGRPSRPVRPTSARRRKTALSHEHVAPRREPVPRIAAAAGGDGPAQRAGKRGSDPQEAVPQRPRPADSRRAGPRPEGTRGEAQRVQLPRRRSAGDHRGLEGLPGDRLFPQVSPAWTRGRTTTVRASGTCRFPCSSRSATRPTTW